MQFETMTEPSAILSSLPERIAEFNATCSDSRCHLEALPSEAGMLRFRVLSARDEAASLDFVGEITFGTETSRISGDILPALGTHRPLSAVLYNLFISFSARLTVLALLYGAILGISFLARGRSFFLPAIPSLVVLLVMIIRALKVRLGLSRRVSRFMCGYLGCKEIKE